MAVSTLISTPAHPRANSYIGLDEANQYFTDQFGTFSWSTATNDQKTQALIEATRLIDSLRFHYEPLKWRTQRLKWPRTNAETQSGTPTSATTNSITDTNLVELRQYPDDFWKYGAVWFYDQSDANFNEYFSVTAFNDATGTFTISGTFTSAVQTSDSYELIQEIPPAIKYAVCETAEAILASTLVSTPSDIKSQSLGDESVTYFDRSVQGVNLPSKAHDLLQPYIAVVGRVLMRGLFR